MSRNVPLTKIIFTLCTAVWALVLHQPLSLLALCFFELMVLALSGQMKKQFRAVFILSGFAAFLGTVQYAGGGTLDSAYTAGLRMMDMTLMFLFLLGTTRLQDLTASMVKQLKIPYEYAFMFTASLRFVPDFLEENRAVAEAQACRGLVIKGNIFKKISRYLAVVQPLMLRSLARSESMALSLELRGFGGKHRTFMESVAPGKSDYLVMIFCAAVTAGVIALRFFYQA